MFKTTSEKIIDYIKKYGQASGKELTDYLKTISDRAVRKQLKNLLDKRILKKAGKPPRVYYSLNTSQKETDKADLSKSIHRTIDENYLYITPTGEIKKGWNGFLVWSEKTNQDPIKTASEYLSTLKKYERYRKDSLIDGMSKMKQTFDEVYLDKIYYLDFYSIERFGKTKLGQMLLYAKQSQNIILIRNLISEIRPRILKLIKKYRIDGILYVPPTVKREIQFMKKLEEQLHLPVGNVSVTKIKTEIIIPQKTLTKLADRIENARKTIIVGETLENKYSNILLIDDAVGSGATMNETAGQIRKRKLVKGQIIGMAITGSFKGFDVISEI